ncbi:short-chain dehydrogenase, partial [Staphylococcus aureus]
QSKLCNTLHCVELARRFKEEGVNVTANSLHPGLIATNIGQNNSALGFVLGATQYLLKNVSQGAATTCFLALNPKVNGVSGEYFVDS